MQMDRFSRPVTEVFVLREGPVPPTGPELIDIVKHVSPDALADQAKLTGLAASPWPEDPVGWAIMSVGRAALEQELRGDPLRPCVQSFTAPDGLRLVVAKLIAPAKAEPTEPSPAPSRGSRRLRVLLLLLLALGVAVTVIAKFA
jgi:hypothetical protein